MRATLRDRRQRRESCDFLNQIQVECHTTEHESDSIAAMPIDAFYNDLDGLRDLVSSAIERARCGLAECRAIDGAE